jgi:hypothetical protein
MIYVRSLISFYKKEMFIRASEVLQTPFLEKKDG